MAGLNIHYQDMQEEVLDFAKKVSLSGNIKNNMLTTHLFMVQLILEVFENFKEERVIANKIRQEFDKNHGKYFVAGHCMQ